MVEGEAPVVIGSRGHRGGGLRVRKRVWERAVILREWVGPYLGANSCGLKRYPGNPSSQLLPPTAPRLALRTRGSM